MTQSSEQAASVDQSVEQNTPVDQAAAPNTTVDKTVKHDDKAAVAETVDDKTVHKKEAPVVEHETVKPSQHKEVETVVDKEVHQDHFHRTIQPMKDKEVLPTKHTYKEKDVEQKEFDHRDDAAAKKDEVEGSKIKDERNVDATKYSEEHSLTDKGEHIHHHIHETIQPVINKTTIQPEVVHVVEPVHETHHLKAEHHGTTTKPEIDVSDYKKDHGTTTKPEVDVSELKK